MHGERQVSHVTQIWKTKQNNKGDWNRSRNESGRERRVNGGGTQGAEHYQSPIDVWMKCYPVLSNKRTGKQA